MEQDIKGIQEIIDKAYEDGCHHIDSWSVAYDIVRAGYRLPEQTDKREAVKETRLITDDCHIDGLREKVIPLWPTLYTYQQNELRILCDEQRKLTSVQILSLFPDEEAIRKAVARDMSDGYKCARHCELMKKLLVAYPEVKLDLYLKSITPHGKDIKSGLYEVKR